MSRDTNSEDTHSVSELGRDLEITVFDCLVLKIQKLRS